MGRFSPVTALLLAAYFGQEVEAAGDARAVAGPATTLPSGWVEQRFDGPGLVCGETFALTLDSAESLIRRDPDLDFLTYQVQARDGGFVLYEGNAPQPHDDKLKTGLNWPSIIAIHDNRAVSAKRHSKVRDRLTLGNERPQVCQNESTR